MARKSRITPMRQISDINLTPLMDLTFILLITFIITFPLIEQGISINLPKADAEATDAKNSRTITVDAEGTLYLDDLKIPREELAQEMMDLGAADSETTILVRADESVRYGVLMEVMKILHDAKITRMALVTAAETQ